MFQSSSEEFELEFDDEFELELLEEFELLFELELLDEFDELFEFEFEFELLLEFEFPFELKLLEEFEDLFALELDQLLRLSSRPRRVSRELALLLNVRSRKRVTGSSATAGVGVAALVASNEPRMANIFFILFLLIVWQPSLTA